MDKEDIEFYERIDSVAIVHIKNQDNLEMPTGIINDSVS